MKNCSRKFLKVLPLMAIVLLASCNKEDNANDLDEGSDITATELVASDEAELISEDIVGIAEDVYATDEITASAKSNYRSDYLPECVTVTTVVTETTKEKTIDFGDGCELPNGNVLSGVIKLSYAKDMEMASKTMSLSLEDFTFNAVAIVGSASIVRMRNNGEGNPESNASWNFNGTWPDGDTASFNGTRTREWIEGYGSGFWGDNVFLITGLGSYTGKLGSTLTKEVTTPLRREWSCRFIVSGVLEITRNDAVASLDFGDGSCDAKGTLTLPSGEETEILLRRFFNK